MDAVGFGLFARGLGYYGPNSLLLLIRYMAKLNPPNPNYATALSFSLAACGMQFETGRFDISTQNEAAMAAIAYGDSILNGRDPLSVEGPGNPGTQLI